MAAVAPDMSTQIITMYNQAAAAVTTAYTTVESYWDEAEASVSRHLENATSAEVRDVALKFFKALPETFMVVGLLLQGKLAMISAICWAVRTVISLMPLLKTLISMDMDQINKGGAEAWANLVKQHKNFIPALAIVGLVTTMHVFHLLSLKSLMETSVFATMTTVLIAALIDPRPQVAAQVAPAAGGGPNGPGGALPPLAKPVDSLATGASASAKVAGDVPAVEVPSAAAETVATAAAASASSSSTAAEVPASASSSASASEKPAVGPSVVYVDTGLPR